MANLIRIAWLSMLSQTFPNIAYSFTNISLNAEMLAFCLCEWCVLNALNAVANLIRFCSYPRLRFDCVGAVYAFANAVYIFANIGANA
ncbi:MAG: hypothetical protein MR582_06585 [Campylobacter sp.]|nr:hypothetical protein [Campylobacter sp.]